jgi:hypothetical protein
MALLYEMKNTEEDWEDWVQSSMLGNVKLKKIVQVPS